MNIHIMAPMQDSHWQLRLVGKSLKKREKIGILEKHLSVAPTDRVLDLGCAQGILSYFLRQRGGTWISADLDSVNLKTSQALLEKNLLQITEGDLPFLDESLDMVVSLDYLEHLDDDRACLGEIHRILKKGGRLLLATPRTGFPLLLNKLRPLLGMKLEFYGHKREGYTLKNLEHMLEETGLYAIKQKGFSGFITEIMELALNFLYVRIYGAADPAPDLRDGHIRPSTSEEFTRRKGIFRAYSLVYPLLWFLSRLDRLFFFQRGYGLMLWAVKPESAEK
ncbi:class I SAM-dependent methyltransferase [Acidobacteriota bacterium]